MFSDEVRKLLVEVVSSWQVIAVTVALIAYFYLINYVARLYRKKRPRRPIMPKIKPEATETPPEAVSDDLGLEEAPKK